MHVTLFQKECTPRGTEGGHGPFIWVGPEACLAKDIQSVLGGGMDGQMGWMDRQTDKCVNCLISALLRRSLQNMGEDTLSTPL